MHCPYKLTAATVAESLYLAIDLFGIADFCMQKVKTPNTVWDNNKTFLSYIRRLQYDLKVAYD